MSIRGLLFRVILGVESGTRFKVGKDTIVSRGRLKVGDRVTIDDFTQVTGDVTLGSGVYLHRHVIIRAFDGFVSIGEGTTVNPFTRIYGKGGVTIGRLVSIAPGVTLVAAEKNTSSRRTPIKEQGVTAKGITVADDVWIAANATILDGVTLGTGCIVGAGAVVTRDVAPFDIVAGVPARVIGSRGCSDDDPGSGD